MIQIPGFIDLHTHTRYPDNNKFPFEPPDTINCSLVYFL